MKTPIVDKKKAVVFGTGAFAEVADFMLTHDSNYDVVGFTATGDHVAGGSFLGRPLRRFDEIEKHFPPGAHDMFIAVGYTKLNTLRERFFNESRLKGYTLLSYVSSRATTWPDLKLGGNCFVFEDNTIQPFVTIGDNAILWSGNHIGHHSRIGSHCFITSHVVVSGSCSVGSHTFIGVNASISEGVSVGERNLIGPGTLVQKSTKAGEVYLAKRTERFPKDSSHFLR